MVCVIVPEGELPEWDCEPALQADAPGWGWTLLACTCGAAQVGAEKARSQPALAFAQDALLAGVLLC